MTDASPDLRLKALASRYLEALNQGDPERVIDLFHENATIEDPVGGAMRHGREEIAQMYRGAFALGRLGIVVDVPPRGSYSDAAAYAFTVTFMNRVLKVIGVLTFDADGLITSMRAFHGPSDGAALADGATEAAPA